MWAFGVIVFSFTAGVRKLMNRFVVNNDFSS
jgi:hypothetical protein